MALSIQKKHEYYRLSLLVDSNDTLSFFHIICCSCVAENIMEENPEVLVEQRSPQPANEGKK